MRPPILTVLASALLAVEGLIVMGLAVSQIVGVLAGESAELPTAIALVALTIVFGAGLVACASGLWRGMTWARSGGIVAQILIFSVGLGNDSIRGGVPGLVVIIPAVIGFVLLLLARQTPDDADPSER